MSLRLLLLIASFFCLLAQENANAQRNRLDEALFVSLPVKAKGENEAQAKSKATKIALQSALDEVFRRFVVDTKKNNNSKNHSFAKNLSDKNIRALTEDLLLERINFSKNTFYGQASVRFSRDKLFALINKKRLLISHTIAPTFLVIPILVINGKTELWPPQNSWLLTWQTESEATNWLVPFIPIEMASFERIAVLDTIKNTKSMQAALLAERYSAQGIALITASVNTQTQKNAKPQNSKHENNELENSKHENNEQKQKPSPAFILQVSGVLEQKGFPIELPTFSLKSHTQKSHTLAKIGEKNAKQESNAQKLTQELTQGLTQEFAEELATLLTRARSDTLYMLNQLWKAETAHSPKRKRLRIIVEMQNREQWQELKNIFEKTPELISHNLRSISARQAHVVAQHYSSLDPLINSLERKGLQVFARNDNQIATISVRKRIANITNTNSDATKK